MKLLAIVTCLLLLAGRAHGITDDVDIDGVTHQREVLYNFNLDPWWCTLAVDNKYNYLYILVSYGMDQIAPVILHLNTKEHKSYLGAVQDAKSVTVDQETHDLYIGSLNGIYKYKSGLGEKQLVSAATVSAGKVYFNGVLYYTDFTSNRLSTLINGHSDKLVRMQYEVSDIAIDNEDVVFFSNRTGLYSRQMDSDHTTFHDWGNVNSLALDRNDKAYFSGTYGIYEIKKCNATSRRVVSVADAQAIAFDKNNNLIYCDNKGVYRLKPKAKIDVTNNCPDHNSKDINIEKQDEGKLLDIMNKKIDQLVTDHVEILKRMDRKNYDLSQKIDELTANLVRIPENNTNI